MSKTFPVASFCVPLSTPDHPCLPPLILDRTRGLDVSTSSTPTDLSPSQRTVLEAALRVDQAGEVAANYIYEGQLANLRRDHVSSALIQASSTLLLVPHHIKILC